MSVWKWPSCWTGHQASKDTRHIHLIEHVAESLVTYIPIWAWESSIDVYAYIARWYTQLETYRGFQLCSDIPGNTFLLDLTNFVYVKDTTEKLLRFDAVEQAKMFVDTLRGAM